MFSSDSKPLPVPWWTPSVNGMPRGPKSVTAFIATFAAVGYAHAQEIGSAQQGLRLAQSQCTECHLVERGGRSPRVDAPTFEEIANTGGMTSAALIAALRTSHKTMPNIIIKDSDLGDFIAYIVSLRRGG